MARESRGASAISRVLTVLDAFSIEHPFLSLSDIARGAGLPVSSTHGIVGELVEHGLLERMPDRSYRVGTRLWEIGSRTPGVLGIREIAQPYLHAAQAAVRQHTQLAVRSDLDVIVIERLSARDGVVNASIVGRRMPLDHSSSGLVLLAHAQDGVLDRVLVRGLRPVTDAGIRTPAQLHTALDGVRRTGYAVSAGWIYEDSRGIAVPVTGSQGVVVGAVGVVVANDDSTVDDYVRVLQRAASGISDALLRSYLPPGHPSARAGGAYRQMVNSSERSMRYLAEHADADGR